jgi:hypothetical protein
VEKKQLGLIPLLSLVRRKEITIINKKQIIVFCRLLLIGEGNNFVTTGEEGATSIHQSLEEFNEVNFFSSLFLSAIRQAKLREMNSDTSFRALAKQGQSPHNPHPAAISMRNIQQSCCLCCVFRLHQNTKKCTK